MPKSKLLILFTVVIAVVALFAATEVMAVDLPDICVAGSAFELRPAAGDFPLILTDCSSEDWTNYGCGACDPPCYVWNYIGRRIKDSVGQVQFALEVCRPHPIEVRAVGLPNNPNEQPSIVDPCLFDSTTRWGGSCGHFLVDVNFQFTTNNKPFFLTTSLAATGLPQVLVKSKKYKLPCENPAYGVPPLDPYAYIGGIPGPACSDQGEVIVSAGTQAEVCGNVKFCVVKNNPATKGCGDEVWASNDTSLSCDDIVGSGTKLTARELQNFYIMEDNVKKIAKFHSTGKGGCRIRCAKYLEQTSAAGASASNATCIDLGGIPYCF